MLFNFIIRMLSAVTGVEQKTDKRGKEFVSLRFDPRGQGAYHWVKSVVMYQPNKKGNISILVNHGGVRMDTGLEFPASTTMTLKPIKGSDLYLILKRGKAVGFAEQRDVDKISQIHKTSFKEFMQASGAYFWVRSLSNGGNIVVAHCGCDYHPVSQLEEVEYSKEVCCSTPNCSHASVWTCPHISKDSLPEVKTLADVYPVTVWDGVSDPF